MLTSSSPNPLSSSPSSSRFSFPDRHRRRRSPNYKTTPSTPNKITCSSSSSSSSSMDPITSLGRLLWGRSLPPSLLISTARSAWHATWHLFMRQLAPSGAAGSYSRPASQFPTVPDPYYSAPLLRRLRLYAAHACPWAHRTLIVLALTLKKGVRVSMAAPGPDGAWELDGGARRLKEVYQTRKGGYDGRATVPMLWDEECKEVVCNESYGIIHFFNSAAAAAAAAGDDGDVMDLAPEEMRGEIERWNGIIYPNVNNGVYRCGFAQSQEAYDAAANDLFTTLDMLESHLAASRYLCGDALTLADVCLFTTLIRFDLVYNVLFKCTKKKLVEYPNLHAYTRDIYQIPKVAETCNFEAIMDGYYRNLFPLNPGSIRPVMPCACEHEHLLQPHNRESLSSSSKQPQLHAI